MAAGLDKGSTIGAALVLSAGSVFAEVSMLAVGGLVGACLFWARDETGRPWWKVAGDASLGFAIAMILGSLAARLLHGVGFLQSNGIGLDMLWAPVAWAIAAFWKDGLALLWLGVGKWVKDRVSGMTSLKGRKR